jgi:glucose/arabinose dehydrogenase
MTLRPFLSFALCALSGAACAASSSLLPGDLQLDLVVSGLSEPVALRHAPADARLFVVQQGGSIRIIDGGSLVPTPFLNVNAGAGGTAPPLGFTSSGERGLLGLAFHPNYTANGQFYVYYTDANGDTVVSRYLRSAGDANLADAASGSVVLRIDQDFSNHNGGDIHFGPDGRLYIGLGDGGRGNDPCNRAQTLPISAILTGTQNGENCNSDAAFTGSGGDFESLALLGKMLRIDVDATAAAVAGDERCGFGDSGTIPYAIPNDNPYQGSDGICDEIWHAGLRNPFRFSFDRGNGDLYIGDVGQSAREEINAVPGDVGGLNFGWRCREGDVAGGNTSLCANPPAFIDPVLTYENPTLGCSVSGGFRYRGPIAALRGVYFYGDFCSGRVFAGRPFNGAWRSLQWQDTPYSVSGFGEGADGALYLVHYGGAIRRFSTSAIFRDGVEPED